MPPVMPEYSRKARLRMRAALLPQVAEARDRALAEPVGRSPQTGQALPVAGPNDNSGQAERQTAPASQALEMLSKAFATRRGQPPAGPAGPLMGPTSRHRHASSLGEILTGRAYREKLGKPMTDDQWKRNLRLRRR